MEHGSAAAAHRDDAAGGALNRSVDAAKRMRSIPQTKAVQGRRVQHPTRRETELLRRAALMIRKLALRNWKTACAIKREVDAPTRQERAGAGHGDPSGGGRLWV